MRAVGTAFLRKRPWIAAFGVALNAILLVLSGAPGVQRAVVAACMLSLLALFVVEAGLLRRRSVTFGWLFWSLLFTALAMTIACGFSGGADSPLVPLLFAPVGVGLAAFGRGRSATGFLLLGLGALLLLLALPPSGAFPRIAAPYDSAMTVVSAGASVILLRIGVAGLTDAHARTAAMLDELRIGALSEAAGRARDAEAVGAKVAHELKNPLASIKGLMQLLAQGTTDARDRKRLDVALSEVDRMHSVLDDYLTFSRPLRDAVLAPLRLDEMLEDLAAFIEPNATRQGVRVELEASPVRAMVDAARIKDAVLNLVSNALSSMPDGGRLGLAVSREGEAAIIRVSDDGKGMTEEQLAGVGAPFVSHREGGTGLGLSLVRGVARQHGGDISIRSVPDGGTTVTLSVGTALELPR